ncbi:GYF domain-containing protein [Opitutales bacterium]|nr:GYF domain-containing protein [Opitutales bacterium]
MKIYLCRSGQTYGPYSENSIHSFFENGVVSSKDWAWAKGQNNWLRLEELLPLLGPEKSHNQEVEEQVSKIKNLVEKGQANAALDLVLGLQSQDVITELLEDCRIIQEDGVPDLPDWIIGSTRFFFDLLFHLQSEHEQKIDESIRPSNISTLHLKYSSEFKNLGVLSKFTKLESLTLDYLDELENIEAIEELKELSELFIFNCSKLDSLESLSPVSECKKLKKLELGGMDFIESTSFISTLTNLESLKVSSIVLKSLVGIENFQKLQSLDLENCLNLSTTDPIGQLPNLKILNLSKCLEADFGFVEKMKSLEVLNMELCQRVTSIHAEYIQGLMDSTQSFKLVLPNGDRIARFNKDEDPGGPLPRIEFYLGGRGIIYGKEGSLTKTQYEYWKDKSEEELIEHCEWDSENEEVPEDAVLGPWEELNNISEVYGCQSGVLEVTEFRELENGWQKNEMKFGIEDGVSENDRIKVTWSKGDRLPPEGPSFQGYSYEKGMCCDETIEGKTFDIEKLDWFSESVFGGAEGEIVVGMEYDGKPLDWCPEGEGKGYYFKVLPAPES